MPRYRQNPHIIPFSMLCPGISQNSKHHQLTLYKGQVLREKSYLELCNQNTLREPFKVEKKCLKCLFVCIPPFLCISGQFGPCLEKKGDIRPPLSTLKEFHSIQYDRFFDGVIIKFPLEKSNELHVPPLPGHWFIVDHTQIPWESEILQSFAELTKITFIMITTMDDFGRRTHEESWQVLVGSYQYNSHEGSHEQGLSPTRYYPWYIWTKAGF